MPALTSFGVSGLCRGAAGRGALGAAAGGRGVGKARVFATFVLFSMMMIWRSFFYMWFSMIRTQVKTIARPEQTLGG